MRTSEDTARSMASPLLPVRGLTVEFPIESGTMRAVEGLSFDVLSGRTVAIVGESGSGKSVTSLAVMGLTRYTGGRIAAGDITLRGKDGGAVDLTLASDEAMRDRLDPTGKV